LEVGCEVGFGVEEGVTVGDECGVGVGEVAGLVVGMELGKGIDEGKDSFVVITVYKPEFAQTFKELLAYSRKPTITPDVLFRVNVAFPQQGVEEKAAQDALTHCPELLVLNM